MNVAPVSNREPRCVLYQTKAIESRNGCKGEHNIANDIGYAEADSSKILTTCKSSTQRTVGMQQHASCRTCRTLRLPRERIHEEPSVAHCHKGNHDVATKLSESSRPSSRRWRGRVSRPATFLIPSPAECRLFVRDLAWL